jgi:hypothetical protein
VLSANGSTGRARERPVPVTRLRQMFDLVLVEAELPDALGQPSSQLAEADAIIAVVDLGTMTRRDAVEFAQRARRLPQPVLGLVAVGSA